MQNHESFCMKIAKLCSSSWVWSKKNFFVWVLKSRIIRYLGCASQNLFFYQIISFFSHSSLVPLNPYNLETFTLPFPVTSPSQKNQHIVHSMQHYDGDHLTKMVSQPFTSGLLGNTRNKDCLFIRILFL